MTTQLQLINIIIIVTGARYFCTPALIAFRPEQYTVLPPLHYNPPPPASTGTTLNPYFGFLLANVTVLPLQACLQRHSWLLPLRAAGPTAPKIRHYLARTQFRAFVLHTILRPSGCVPGSTTQVPTATWPAPAASGVQDVWAT